MSNHENYQIKEESKVDNCENHKIRQVEEISYEKEHTKEKQENNPADRLIRAAEANMVEAVRRIRTAMSEIDLAIIDVLEEENIVRATELRCAQLFFISSEQLILEGLATN